MHPSDPVFPRAPVGPLDPAEPNAQILDPADEAPQRRRLLGDWLSLQRQLALQPKRARELLERARTPAEALREGGLCADPPSDLAETLHTLVRVGARVLPVLSSAYPERLRRLPDGAPVLSVQGDCDALARTGVAIVGARAPSAYGLACARLLAGELAVRGVVVLSGLARGIDAAAHRAALDAGGRTVAVQACGPDCVYPPEHAELAAEIVRGAGAVVTELPVGTPPLPGFFPLRNRLISGLSRVVVVVEARRRSGSLVTARHALDQGVEVLAVPGPIDRATSAGTNRLIRDGAAPVLEVADVLDRIDTPVGEGGSTRPRGTSGAHLSEEARGLLGALQRRAASRDELARQLGRTPKQLALPLLDLELRGLVATDRDGRFRAVRDVG